MRIVAVVNQKGGCGKTTTALNAAAALAELGQRVLLLDFDPQAHATIGLGHDPNDLERTIYDVLVGTDVLLSSVVIHTSVNGLDLAPSNVLLASAELELVGTPGKELLLGHALQGVENDYDFCLVDCPPSLGILTLNALVNCTEIIVPVQVHYYALEGLRRLLETVHLIRQRFHPRSAGKIGLLLTFVEDRTTFSRQIQQQMREIFRELVFDTVIHRNVRLAEAPSAGEPVLTYAPQSKGAADYRALAAEILQTHPCTSETPTEKARRGIQKNLTTIFSGVWIPEPAPPDGSISATSTAGIEST